MSASVQLSLGDNSRLLQACSIHWAWKTKKQQSKSAPWVFGLEEEKKHKQGSKKREGKTDRWTVGWTDGLMDGRIDGLMDWWVDEQIVLQ